MFEGENMVFQAIGLIFIFMNISLQMKLMNQDILREILIMKLKDKKHQKKNLIVYLSELILMKKDFNKFKEINKIQRHVKKFLIDKI